jgi:hypothetical protein
MPDIPDDRSDAAHRSCGTAMPRPALHGIENPDEQDLASVASRLGKSIRWVQARMTQPGLDFHHYIGRSPRWDEQEFQQFRAAIIQAENDRRGRLACASSSATDSGISKVLSAPRDVQRAYDRVRASRPARTRVTLQKPSG